MVLPEVDIDPELVAKAVHRVDGTDSRTHPAQAQFEPILQLIAVIQALLSLLNTKGVLTGVVSEGLTRVRLFRFRSLA